MGALARLSLYAAGLALVAGAAAGLGRAVGPVDDDRKDDMRSTHATAGHGGAATESASGLGVARDGYRLVLDEATLPTGRPAPFRFRILGADGAAVRDFDLEGDVRMHLIVVRRDLTGYQHLHPTLDPDGAWTTELTLPRGGVYRAFADFERRGDKTVLGADLFAAGEFSPVPLTAPATTVRVDGYEVRLDGHARAGHGDGLVFSVRRGGEPVALEPYLGARGHLVALRGGDLAYLHVHPLRDEEPGEIAFAATFPTPGPYRLFLQFSEGGRVRTAAFTLEVAP